MNWEGKVAKSKKNGPFSAEEFDFIKQKQFEMTAGQIAEHLGRNVNTIISHLKEMGVNGSKADILNLRKREDWKVIKGQLTPEELVLFEWHWDNIVQQFKEEIYHTEGMQVINAIKHEILANRMLTDQKKIIDLIESLSLKLQAEEDSENPDLHRISSLEKQIANLCQVQEVNNKEYRENSKKLGETLQGLKATRQQRKAQVEDSKTNFAQWMSRIQNDPAKKREVGINMEKMRLAKYAEIQRLSQLHRFENSEYDRPFLNCDSVNMEDMEIENEGEIHESGGEINQQSDISSAEDTIDG
jgi:predicted transcriptional regulator